MLPPVANETVVTDLSAFDEFFQYMNWSDLLSQVEE